MVALFGTTAAPGGGALIRQAVGLCGFAQGDPVADIGCGAGETVALLRREFGLEACGVDIDAALVAALADPHILQGTAERLPFGDGCMEGLLFACSLSLVQNKRAALRECARVLRPGGRLVVGDLYARAPERARPEDLARVEPWAGQRARIEAAGFALCHFEDRSPDLAQRFGELIFAHGGEALEQRMGAELELLKRVSGGYYLAIFAREG
ncbi:MAG: class I SAM-dependent methyltransferase [Clostridiales bacterium]|nr:class I SAM-dependent methyltransferase [Clostridiales bacterium]